MIRRYRQITQRPDYFNLDPGAILGPGLVAAYLAPVGLVGLSSNHDSSLRGNHGTLSVADGTNWIFDSDLQRLCLYLNGSGNTSSTGGLQTAVEGASALTVSAWICPAAYGDASQAYIHQVIGDDQAVSNGTFGLRLGTDGTAAGKGKIYAHAMTSIRDSVGGSTVIPLNSWTHVLFRWAMGGSKTLWVNGVQDATGSADSGTISTSHYSPLKIGDDGKRGRYWEGNLADILVYTTDMSAFVAEFADPSNVMLSGLILPPRRVVFPAPVAAPSVPSGSANLSAVADLTATGHAAHRGSATIAAQAAIAAVGHTAYAGSADLSAVAEIAAAGHTSHAATAALEVIGSIEAAGYAEHSGAATITAEASIAATGHAEAAGSVGLAAIASITVVGESPSIIPVEPAEGSATLSATASIEVVGYAIASGEATLQAVASIAVVGYAEAAGSAGEGLVAAGQAHTPCAAAVNSHTPTPAASQSFTPGPGAAQYV